MKTQIIIVGAGLSGATIARVLTDHGKDVLVFEEKEIGGHCADYKKDDILIHAHGPHIWHNSDKEVQDFVERFTEFNGYVHKCKVKHYTDIYSFPPNLSTFNQIYGTTTIEQAKAVDLTKLNKILFDEYLIKQWGEVPPKFVTDRIPIRYTYNDRYYNDRWEGVPLHGYKKMIENMLGDIKVEEGAYDYSDGFTVVYTGAIDQYFKYEYGPLSYRALRFEHERHEVPDYQGVAHMSYTAGIVPYTRIVEHKHFHPVDTPYTWITKEFSLEWEKGLGRYYPKFDRELYEKYALLAEDNFYFAGRLGSYKYLNMNEVVRRGIDLAHKILKT